jgi:hypothetical protein
MMPIPWLTDRSRSLVYWLAIRTVAEQLGCTEEEAATGLDELVDRGEITLRGDDRNVYLLVGDNPIVHATRGWLAGRCNPSAN